MRRQYVAKKTPLLNQSAYDGGDDDGDGGGGDGDDGSNDDLWGKHTCAQMPKSIRPQCHRPYTQNKHAGRFERGRTYEVRRRTCDQSRHTDIIFFFESNLIRFP